jgi:hypothetical protein
MRLTHALKSTHWVVWSSPVLLLVLVFTWTASSSSTPARHLDTLSVTPPITRSTGDSQTPPTTIPIPTTTTPAAHAKVRPAVHRTVLAKAPIVTVPTTSVVRAKSSSGANDSNVKSNVNASAANASSGVVSGRLSPTFNVADVPLQGPGNWAVASSAPASVTLTCAGTTITVNGQFVVAAHTTCQVTITAETPSQFVTWELTPTN